ncbi:MAG: hypothetical protein ACKOBO_04255 [Acidimicrobiales bacterium]
MQLVDGIRESFSRLSCPVTWKRVSVPGLPVAWAGMQVPAVDTGGRPWVWEVVTPEQYDTSDALRDDILVLPVQHDAVVVKVTHRDHSGPIVRMQIPVDRAPDHLVVEGLPREDNPITVTLERGWTVEAMGSAAQAWIDRETDSSATLKSPETLPSTGPRYRLHPDFDFESAAFDRLLTLDHDDAASVTSLLARIHEALKPYR